MMYDTKKVDQLLEMINQQANDTKIILFIDIMLKNTSCNLTHLFNELSLWEQQSVMFELSDIIYKISKDKAQEIARQARKEEPI